MNMLRNNLVLSYTFAVISGLLMMLSMPSYDLGILAWFGLVPLLVVLPNKSSKHQYLLIQVTTIIWSVGTHLWYPSILSSWGYVIMIAGGLYYGALLKMGYDMNTRIRGWYAVFALPVTFSVFEWVKTIIPFTKTWWIELVAKSQWLIPANLQILSVTGFIGLTFLIILTNTVIAKIIIDGFGDKRRMVVYIALLLLPIMNTTYGNLVMKPSQALLSSQPITIGANVDMINQDPEVIALGNEATAGDGYLADTPDMKQKIFDINRELSRQLISQKQADFIVWGENEFMNLDDQWLYEQFVDLSKELGAIIVADTVWKQGDHMYDTAVMVDPEQGEIGRTPKIFTLWGEEEYGFSPGPRDYPVYDTAYGRAALAVCWDRHDPSILRGYARNGAQIALIPADDDFDGNGQFPPFAASDAVFRAVENHLAIGSGSTSGVAQVITPYGEMTAMSQVNERENIIGDTFVVNQQTFYTKYGDVFAYGLSACFLILFLISERNKVRDRKAIK